MHQSMKHPYKRHILPSPSNTLSMSAAQLLAHHRQILCPHGANYEFLSHKEIMPSRIYPVTFCWDGGFIFSFNMDRGRQFWKLPVITGILLLCFLRSRNISRSQNFVSNICNILYTHVYSIYTHIYTIYTTNVFWKRCTKLNIRP